MSRILIISTLLILTIAPLAAYAVDGQIPIVQTETTVFPIVIDEPGSYVIGGDIVVPTYNVNGIEIRTDDVTLNLNGFTIKGPGKTSGLGSGVYAPNRNNIAVLNGTIRDFGEHGLLLAGSGANRHVRNLRAYNNGITGIVVSHGVVTDSIASSNGGDGITVSFSSLMNCTANYNSMRGIHASEQATVMNCNVTGNKSYGIYLPIGSNIVANCNVSDNGSSGVLCLEGSTVMNVTANRNGQHGILAFRKCRIEGNNLRDNRGLGLNVVGPNTYAIRNTASNNAGAFYAQPGNYMPTSLTAADAANANVGW